MSVYLVIIMILSLESLPELKASTESSATLKIDKTHPYLSVGLNAFIFVLLLALFVVIS